MFEGEKDREPLDTIKISTDYLHNNKVFFCEEWHENSSALFSVTLRIPGTGFTVNGKGVNRELALASAHGELQERLLNKALFRINSDTLYWIKSDGNTEKSNVALLFDKIGVPKDKAEEILGQCDSLPQEMSLMGNDIFYSTKGEKIIIPNYVTDFLYGTNGMCAGNTQEEACVQGLAEIIERYVAKQLFKENLKVPHFNYTKLAKAEYFRKIIQRLTKYGIEVCVKDFSLGIGLPVVGAIFCNKESNTFFLKMGAHPNLNIALERCFTEFAQGRTDNLFDRLVSCGDAVFDEDDRLLSYFTDGNTAFPIRLLYDGGESNIESQDCLTNKEYCHYLEEKVEALGYEIFRQDNSSDEFSALRIIVPGMSEIASVEKIPFSRNKFYVEWKLKHWLGCGNPSEAMVDEMAKYFIANNDLNKEIGLYYPIVSVKMNGRKLPRYKLFELINLQYIMAGILEKSYAFLKSHMSLFSEDSVYLCIMLMEHLTLEEKFSLDDKEKIYECLSKLFNKEIVDLAYMILTQPNELFTVECNIEDNYFFKNRKELYVKLYGSESSCSDSNIA